MQSEQPAGSGEANRSAGESEGDGCENRRKSQSMIDDDRALGSENPQITKYRDIGQYMCGDKSTEEEPVHDE